MFMLKACFLKPIIKGNFVQSKDFFVKPLQMERWIALIQVEAWLHI